MLENITAKPKPAGVIKNPTLGSVDVTVSVRAIELSCVN